ncbi:uncharacterized protein [Nicotiana tomentosiformis]|uniref:uncharacterized protein isoform X1 n=1 Tax=Nicotiana tomentosiformis TaxID=4098 RepID=UPI00388C8814
MGACGSKARRCIGMNDLHRKKHQGGRNSVSHKLNKIEPSASKNISCSSSLSKGNGEFDPEVMIESESSNDFHSAQDVFSQSGSGSFSTAISPRFYDTVCCNSNAAFDSAVKHEQSFANAEPNIVRDDYGFTLDKVSSRNMDRNAARAEGVSRLIRPYIFLGISR